MTNADDDFNIEEILEFTMMQFYESGVNNVIYNNIEKMLLYFIDLCEQCTPKLNFTQCLEMLDILSEDSCYEIACKLMESTEWETLTKSLDFVFENIKSVDISRILWIGFTRPLRMISITEKNFNKNNIDEITMIWTDLSINSIHKDIMLYKKEEGN